MDDWIDYYDSTHTIYVSKVHRDVHFRLIAKDIAGFIPSPGAVVLDYSCGEALFAAEIAKSCGQLILAEPAPKVRGRLVTRFAMEPKIKVLSLPELADITDASVDLAVMISVTQYMTPSELDDALAMIRRVLRPGGRFVLGDVLRPNVGAPADAMALLRLSVKHGFFQDAVIGIARTALSDYRKLRQRIGLQRYTEAQMISKLAVAGLVATLSPLNVGHNPDRMTFIAHAL